jgi:hypothetical protein
LHKRIKLIVAFSTAVVVFAGFYWKLYIVGDSAQDDVLLWNQDQAYLFIGWGRSGYHFTGFEYLFAHIPAYFGIPRTVDDNRLSIIVFRITPTAIERYVAEPYQMYRGFLGYFPRGDTIYAYDGGATLWKWAGARFETVTPEEQRGLALELSSQGDYTNVDGWSSRHSLTARPTKSEIEVQGKPVALFTKVKDSGREVTVEVRLAGGKLQRILQTTRAWHLVSKSEYEEIFRKP